MTNPVDIDAVRAAWERLEAACAGLLAQQCKSHRPYMGCPMDCGDVTNALDPELAEARPLIAAVIEECHGRRFDPNLRSELAEAHEALAAARAEAGQLSNQNLAEFVEYKRRRNEQHAAYDRLYEHAMHLANRIDPPGDWACAECRPNSTMLKGDGWRCDVHALRAIEKSRPHDRG